MTRPVIATIPKAIPNSTMLLVANANVGTIGSWLVYASS